MQAVIFEEYGGPEVLKLAEVEKPTPADDEVLVRVRASSVNPAEWYEMVGIGPSRMSSGWRRPKDPRLGADFAGVVEAVGAEVSHVKVGDEVYGGRGGAFAEYVCVKNAVVRKPANASFAEAAAVPIAGLTALQGLRDHAQLQAGEKVLINGASGGVGTFAVQVAKAMGAEVTGVCSPRNVEQTRALGADRVVDYTKEDFSQLDERYDAFFDVAGGRSWRDCARVLKPESRFIIVGAPKSSAFLGPLPAMIKLRLGAIRASQSIKFFVAQFNRPDLDTLREMIEAGQVKSVIDREYPLSETAAAMAYLGEGHARGKVVLTIPG